MMTIITRVVGGRIDVQVPRDWPEGAEVEIHPRGARSEADTAPLNATSSEDWRRRILETAGKWQGDFNRPEQGEYERREPLS